MFEAITKLNNFTDKSSQHKFALLILIAIGIGYASSVQAAEQTVGQAVKSNQSNSIASTNYVDSVHKWGAWDLDIEPAAGGVQPQKTQPVNARGTNLRLRTNSFSAVAPKAPPAPIIVVTAVPTTPVTTPAAPVVPFTPTVNPINPSVPVPTGAP